MIDSVFIKIEHLGKYYPIKGGFLQRKKAFIRAVDDVSFFIKQGETLGLVGESGCGKTTLGRCIIRLEEPSKGNVCLENQNILAFNYRKMRKLRQDLQIIFQDPYSSLNPRKTAGHIIGEPFVIHGLLSKKEKRDKVQSLMKVVGLLSEQNKRYPHEFSGGQRQRISIARALALNPKFVVADEPVSALDVSIQAQILNLLVEIQSQFNLTYLFISHDLSVVSHISDRVAVMYLGRIVEIAENQSLYTHPYHPYSEALMVAAPVPDPLRKKAKQTFLEGDVPSPIDVPSGCSFHPRCQYSRDICTKSRPELTEIKPDHTVACHFPVT
jgi:oligopeptide/dipeptide ABC transporter ATP-binding protein